MENKRDYTGAVFMIFLGAIFLLNTTGTVGWDIWLYIFRFWPIFLILGGLRLLLGKTLAATITISVIAFCAFLTIGTCAYSNQTNSERPFLSSLSNVCRNFEINEGIYIEKDFSIEKDKYSEIDSINYDIDLGISQFELTDGDENFLDLNARYTSTYGEPKVNDEIKDGIVGIDIVENSNNIQFANFNSPKYKIQIGTDAVTAINIDNGVGQGNIKLTSQKITELLINNGTGEINIELGIDSIPSEILKIDSGTGRVNITLPSNVGYLLSYELGLGDLNVDGEENNRFTGGSNKDVKSSNYDISEKIIIINADIGIGSLNINFSK